MSEYGARNGQSFSGVVSAELALSRKSARRRAGEGGNSIAQSTVVQSAFVYTRSVRRAPTRGRDTMLVSRVKYRPANFTDALRFSARGRAIPTFLAVRCNLSRNVKVSREPRGLGQRHKAVVSRHCPIHTLVGSWNRWRKHWRRMPSSLPRATSLRFSLTRFPPSEACLAQVVRLARNIQMPRQTI
jgi:hypothetical protein